jgi:hypothetical protein
LTISGTIFARAASVTAKGNGTADVFGSQVIANSMTLTGDGTINIAFAGNSSAVTSLRSVGLVEGSQTN